MPLIIIIFGVLLLFTVIIIAVHKASSKSGLSQSCSTDADCPKGDHCVADPQAGGKTHCIPSDQLFCKIDPPTELKQCECPNVDENGICVGSTGCDKCLNNPKFSCIQVSDKHPYSWQQGNKKITIPNSPRNYGWCLPNVINRDVKCNPYTSEYILAQVGDNEYEWGCYCKYPNLFGNSNTLNNCDFVYACAASVGEGGEKLGTLMVPSKDEVKCHLDSDCPTNEKCLQPRDPPPCGYNSTSKHIITTDCKDSNNCVCHTEWAGEYTLDSNPLDGQCVCNKLNDKQLDYQCVVRSQDYFEMNCVKGYCGSVEGSSPTKKICTTPGETGCCDPQKCFHPDPNDPSQCMCCDCPDGYIQCPDQIASGNEGLILYCQETGPMCVKDPCATPQVPGGYWNGQNCECGKGHVAIEDENSAVGQICGDPCAGNGPCGNRGTCYFPDDGQTVQDARCCDCVCPYTNENDDTCTCSNTSKNSGGNVKIGSGGECWWDNDCCSGDCHGGGGGSSGFCRGASVITSPCNAKKKCIPKPPKPPVTCDDGSSCPYDTSCCALPGGDKYNCCPYSDGTCCDDGYHCCPSSHPKCDSAAKVCRREDGSDPISWTGHT